MRGRSLVAAFGGIAISVLFLGCAPRAAVTGPTEVQTVMNAQRAAKSTMEPMSGDEADTIYKNYVANIGKPVKPTSSLSDGNTR